LDSVIMGKDHDKEVERAMTHEDAIGLIETLGFVGIIEAADVMCKAANVEIVGKESVGGGYVTVMVKGDVAAVKAAVEAGAEAVTRMGGKLVVAHIIARPHDGVRSLLPRQQ
jgi:microcompartment protein CcmL/EutN